MTRAAAPIAIESLVARHPEQRVAAEGHALSYRAAGAGPALVLLHGIGSGAASWVHQLAGLADRFRVVAWNAPGYGGSDALAVDAPTAGDYAAALARLLVALAIDRAVLVGQSLGAIMATRFAATHPERLRGLVLLSPARGYGRAPPEERERRLQERVAAMRELGPLEHARARAERQLGASPSAQAHALVVWNMSRLNPAGYAQAAQLLSQGDIGVDAPRYRGPVLVASGTADRITPEAGCREVAALFVDAQYRSLGPVGHASYAEAPDGVNTLLAEFAGGLPA